MPALGLPLVKTSTQSVQPVRFGSLRSGSRLQKDHWRIAEAQGALGENLTEQKRYPEAEPFLVESHHILNARFSQRDPRTKEALRRLITLYEDWGKPDAASEYRNKT
jgi:hypothetical protein